MLEKLFTFFLWCLIIFLPVQFGRHFWPKSAYLFGLKVDYLSPTIYFQDLIVLFMFFLWQRCKDNKFSSSQKHLLFVLTLFALVNIFFSISRITSLFWWLRITEYFVLAMIITQKKQDALVIFLKVIPFLIVFESILGFIQLARGSSIGGFFWIFGERNFNLFTPGIAKASFIGRGFLRPYGTFSHPNSLAAFVLIGLIFVINKQDLFFFDKISILSGIILIIFCFSRVIWFSLFLFFLIMLFERLIRNIKKKQWRFDFKYLITLLFLLVFVGMFTLTDLSGSSYIIRLKLTNFAIKLIKDNWLFGVGGNNFIIALSQSYNSWDYLYWLQPVHNIFLLLASETGLIGLAIFVTFLVLTAKRLLSCYLAILLKKPNFTKASLGKQDNMIARYQNNKLTGYSMSLTIALFVILFTGLFDHYWLTLIQNQLLLVFIFAFIYGGIDRESK